MNKRLALSSVLVMLIIVGLTAGLFAGSIQKALTLPAMQSKAAAAPANKKPAIGPVQPSPTANAGTIKTQTPTKVLAQDTFQRNNQALWGTSSDGRTWGGDANVQQSFSIAGASGQIAQSQGQKTFNAVLGQSTSNAEVLISGMINQFGDGVNIGAVLRWTDANNLYKVLIDGNNLTVIKLVNGQNTPIATQPFKAQNNAVYSLRFRTIGAMLFAKVWLSGTTEPANWMITVSDNTLTTGQAGIRVLVQTNTIVNITSFMLMPASMGNTI